MLSRAVCVIAAVAFVAQVAADIRFASTPRTEFKVRQREQATVKFVNETAVYMEPATFGYAKLRRQRQRNYDNFLRSNIDNQQDNRNFVKEPGKDHLPFRTWNAMGEDVEGYLQEPFVAKPGQQRIIPLRWNNPHASELEVNVWIAKNKVVVPVRKPACAGEGHQDAAFSFMIPTDFNELGRKVPGFRGCNEMGDCVLQVYYHSVEPRTYAVGVPLVVPGFDQATATATDWNQVAAAVEDPGSDLTNLRELCLPSSDPTVHHTSAVPRMARLVSDQYNHAYQNSDYSPYHGQQQELISRNLQASCFVFMAVGNRGELGKSILTNEQKNMLNKVRKIATRTVRRYEGIANKIIKQVGDTAPGMQNRDMIAGVQGTATCFRCAEVGATNPNRLQTTTYIPSFQLPANRVDEAKALVPAKYSKLINERNVVQIYVQTLEDMSYSLQKLENMSLPYQPAMIKSVVDTMPDATKFRKIDANGNPDQGQYAARKAYDATRALSTTDPCRGGTMEEGEGPNVGDVCRTPTPWHCPNGCYQTADKMAPYCLVDGTTEAPCKIKKLVSQRNVNVVQSELFGRQSPDSVGNENVPPTGIQPLFVDPSMGGDQPDGPCDNDADLAPDCPDQVPGYEKHKKDDKKGNGVNVAAAVAVPFVLVAVGLAGGFAIMRQRKMRAQGLSFMGQPTGAHSANFGETGGLAESAPPL